MLDGGQKSSECLTGECTSSLSGQSQGEHDGTFPVWGAHHVQCSFEAGFYVQRIERCFKEDQVYATVDQRLYLFMVGSEQIHV